MTYTNAVVKREDFTDKEVDYAIDLLKEKIKFRLKQKGYKYVISDFECVGLMRQELMEYEQAIHQKLVCQDRIEELLDISWAALLGVILNNALIDCEFANNSMLQNQGYDDLWMNNDGNLQS